MNDSNNSEAWDFEETDETPSIGEFLKQQLKKPLKSRVNYIMLFLGRDHQIWDGKKCIAFTYYDAQGNQGIVVLDGDYDAQAYEFAQMYEKANPQAGKVAVHFVNR